VKSAAHTVTFRVRALFSPLKKTGNPEPGAEPRPPKRSPAHPTGAEFRIKTVGVFGRWCFVCGHISCTIPPKCNAKFAFHSLLSLLSLICSNYAIFFTLNFMQTTSRYLKYEKVQQLLFLFVFCFF
jgi:hypothetical protein